MLLGGLGLMASRPAHSVGGPVAVSVANTPLAVTDAGGTPFMTDVTLNIGSNASSVVGTFAVPAGKRLVVQTVSVFRNGSLTLGSGVQVYLDSQTNGLVGSYAVPPAIATGGEYPGSSVAETFQADAGSTVYVYAYRTVNTGTESDNVTVSGYLVNAS